MAIKCIISVPRRDKTCLRGFRQSETKTSLLSYNSEISLVASFDMIFSNKRTSKALIRLRGFGGWSAPLFVRNPPPSPPPPPPKTGFLTSRPNYYICCIGSVDTDFWKLDRILSRCMKYIGNPQNIGDR